MQILSQGTGVRTLGDLETSRLRKSPGPPGVKLGETVVLLGDLKERWGFWDEWQVTGTSKWSESLDAGSSDSSATDFLCDLEFNFLVFKIV